MPAAWCVAVSPVTSPFCVQVELDKYNTGVDWVRQLLFQTRLTADRLRVVATKMINEVAEVRRNGRFVANALITGMLYTRGETGCSGRLDRCCG